MFIILYNFISQIQSTNFNLIFSLYLGESTRIEEIIHHRNNNNNNNNNKNGGGEKCKICGKILRNRITLRRHIKDLHYAQTEEFWCKICNRCYRTKNSLVVHTCNYHQKRKTILNND